MDGRKRISCQRCQRRKSRCNRVYPCNTCTAAGARCQFREDDSKRRPVARDYVVALEEQVASYESVLKKLKAASNEDRNSLLDNCVFEDHLPTDESQAVAQYTFDYSGSSRMSTMSLEVTSEGSTVYHGPTSIYQKDLSSEQGRRPIRAESHDNMKNWQRLNPPSNLTITDDIIRETTSLFFLYQYSQCMFIYYEAFLRDYYHNSYGGRYYSYPLLYSVCALGARTSPELELREKGDRLYQAARDMLCNHGLQPPDITVVQAHLCLAFYELVGGNHSNSWLFSGMAFRMAQDLGLHQDPKFWAREDSTINNEVEMGIRRRIYWGCYVADKLISLYLGRPVHLSEQDAAVDPLNPLVDLFKGHSPSEVIRIAEPYIASEEEMIFPAFLSLVELSKIIEDVLSQIFGTKMIKKTRRELVLFRFARVEELNVRLLRWHATLPNTLAWNQWNPPAEPLKPHAAMLHLLYYNVLISLNRHFVRPTPGFGLRKQSLETCIASADGIIAMVRQYQAQFKLQNCPIVLVYSIVVAASALLLTQVSASARAGPDQRLKFLFRSLDECAETHGFAREARMRLQKSMEINHDAATAPQPRQRQRSSDPEEDQDPNLAQAQISSPIEFPWTGWIGSGDFDFVGQVGYDFHGTPFEYPPLASASDPLHFLADESFQIDERSETDDIGLRGS